MGKGIKVKKEMKENKKALILIGIVVVILMGMLIMNALTSLGKISTRNCLRNMLLIAEAMQVMEKGFPFEFDLEKQNSKQILYSIYAYFEYGDEAFVKGHDGTLRLVSTEELKQLASQTRFNIMAKIEPCPKNGTYTLSKSTTIPGLFDITCDVHGNLILPDKDGRYAFTGNLDVLTIRDTPLGREGIYYFSQIIHEFLGKESARIKSSTSEE